MGMPETVGFFNQLSYKFTGTEDPLIGQQPVFSFQSHDLPHTAKRSGKATAGQCRPTTLQGTLLDKFSVGFPREPLFLPEP